MNFQILVPLFLVVKRIDSSRDRQEIATGLCLRDDNVVSIAAILAVRQTWDSPQVLHQKSKYFGQRFINLFNNLTMTRILNL
jgi:hypothetical protein